MGNAERRPPEKSGAREVGQDLVESVSQPWDGAPIAPNPVVRKVYVKLLAAGSEWQHANDWTCPAHDDSTASLSVTAGDKQAVVLFCHAGCKTKDVLAKLELRSSDLQGKMSVVNTYKYADIDGTMLFEVDRLQDEYGAKSFRQAGIDAQGRRRRGDKPMEGVKRVLWKAGLIGVAARKGWHVYITEGESGVLAFPRGRGMIATTAAGGAQAEWLPSYTEALVGCSKVTIVADRDDAGYEHAAKVFDSVTAAGIPARVVLSRTTAKKDDLVDHLEAGYTLAELVPIERQDLITPRGPAKSRQTSADGDKAPSVAQQLVEIAMERYRFGQSSEGRAFAVPRQGPNVAREVAMSGRSPLQAELAAEFYRRLGKVPTATALSDARAVILGQALSSEPEPWALRMAQPEPHRIVIDLGDETGRAIEVTPSGWRLLDTSPVLFRRTEMVKAFPEPSRDGDLRAVRELLNVGDAGFDFVVAWLVAGFFPDIAHAALMVNGEYGSAKTAATNLLVQLLDPSAALVQTAPTTLEAWATLAAGTYVVALENVSRIHEWLSDAICRAVTGDGIVRRKLYSDGEMYVTTFRRVVIINGIEVTGIRGDLGDRLATLDLARIDPSNRKEDSVARAQFEAAWPATFGALLDLLAEVLKIRAEGRDHLNELPRLADFAKVVRAVDIARGTDALATYLDHARNARVQLAEDHPLTKAMGAMLSLAAHTRRNGWKGSPTDLLQAIEHHLDDRRSMPGSAAALSSRLTEIAPNLRAAGWTVNIRKSNGHRLIEIAMPSDPEDEERDEDADA